ncbi:hypothetical protein [Halobacillus campisalis]|uniref:Uncharacterized protein n=1 Tax=Halobacillus campisalis TaxID=435909 RepID=A0ABW2K733_9BACI|nr:hypothetical protein [Halobacillus campisalis]
MENVKLGQQVLVGGKYEKVEIIPSEVDEMKRVVKGEIGAKLYKRMGDP